MVTLADFRKSADQLDVGAKQAYIDMATAAAKDGIELPIGSGRRSTERQAQLFEAAVAKYGSHQAARKWVAPPGHSVHETGRAIDFGNLMRSGGRKSPAFQWLKANAGAYGFTNYDPEPWHWEFASNKPNATPVPTEYRRYQPGVLSRLGSIFSPRSAEAGELSPRDRAPAFDAKSLANELFPAQPSPSPSRGPSHAAPAMFDAKSLANELFPAQPSPSRGPSHAAPAMFDAKSLANELFPPASLPQQVSVGAPGVAPGTPATSPAIQAMPPQQATVTPEELAAQAAASGGTPQEIADAQALIAHEGAVRQRAGYREQQPAVAPQKLLQDLDPEDPTMGPVRAAVSMGLGAAGSGLGAAGGALAGGALAGPPGAIAGGVAGEMAGSLAARKAAVALGAEEPGLGGDIAAVALPPVVRGIGGAGKAVLRRGIPGGRAAVHTEMAEQLAHKAPRPAASARTAAQAQLEAVAPGTAQRRVAQQTLESLQPGTGARAAAQEGLEALRPAAGRGSESIHGVVDQWQPPTPSAALYAPLYTDVTPIRPSNIWKAAGDVLKREESLRPAFREPRITQVASDLKQLIREHQGTIPLNVLVEHQQRLGIMIEAASAQRWPQERALKQLYAAFIQDAEYAATQGVTGAAQFRKAAATARREFALDDIRKMLEPGAPGVGTTPDGVAKLPKGEQLERSLSRKRLNDDLFLQSFTPDEWGMLYKQLKTAQSDDAVVRFLEKLDAGKPGMGTGVSGATQIENISPIRTAFERELTENPTFAAAIPREQVQQLRTTLNAAEYEQALEVFRTHLQPGRPGIVVDSTTGQTRIADPKPLRITIEKELAENPLFAVALDRRKVESLRTVLDAAEKEQTLEVLNKYLRPGQTGIRVDADTGLVAIDNIRPVRIGLEKELAGNPALSAALGPEKVRALREGFAAAEREQAQNAFSEMLKPGAPGITQHAEGIVQLDAVKIRQHFEQRLATDPDFAKAIPVEQRAAVRAVLGDIEKLPKFRLPNTTRTTVGRGVTGFGGGFALGGPMGAAVGTIATEVVSPLIAKAVLTPGGRAWLLRQIQKEGGVSAAALGLVSSMARQQVGEALSPEELRGELATMGQ